MLQSQNLSRVSLFSRIVVGYLINFLVLPNMFKRIVYLMALTLLAPTVSFAQKGSDQDKPLGVIVQPVSSQSLENNLETVGSLKANEATVLTAKTTKVIEKIYFDDGQFVKKGQPIVDMLNIEESALADEAKINAEEAKKQWERISQLAGSGAISKAQLDQSFRDYKASEARYQSVISRRADQVITAPFDGVLGMRSVSVGGLVSTGQPITTIVDVSKLKLDFYLPSSLISQVKKGLEVEAVSADLGGKIFKGVIISIDNQVDETTRSIKVRALLNNDSHDLVPGLFMNVSVKSAPHVGLIISESALVPMASNNFVFVAKPSEKAGDWVAVKQQVQIGQRYKGYVEILSGLSASDRVVTHGLQKIRPGQSLHIISEQAPASSSNNETLKNLLLPKAKGDK